MALSLHCVTSTKKKKYLYKSVVPAATMDKADYKFEPHLLWVFLAQASQCAVLKTIFQNTERKLESQQQK